MAKVKLGARPKSFKLTVKFQDLDGTEAAILCDYRYRTRKEFGEFIDGMMQAAGVTPPPDGEKFSMAALMEKTAGANADYILQVLDGWNLDFELTRENLQQLSDEMPAATTAIMERYRLAITEGRLGN